MAHVPDKLVGRRVKDAVQRQRQLDHSEVWTEMPAIFGEHRDQLLADFAGKLRELLQRQFLDVRWTIHHVQVSARKTSLLLFIVLLIFTSRSVSDSGRLL